ncbi:NAD(P)H-dependent oxidoreductase [Roseomonas populi]|uniref:Gfo/Idh/MocA family oxidoreductase n=1 Tax=Roseomonas populi TaxID=3121582 RepID=A0ABT1X7Y3_9PROT|nr:Gfo/Idh/MocA family oxidoreductase [Roseomonas pecuniae]MCR0983851.1 Gfo/Idh/MocA family oxidoreductase [Roseomonas pecuniae]
MNLYTMLRAREAASRPIRVGLIGAGKFGTMFLAQAIRTPGLHVMGVADLQPEGVRQRAQAVDWPAERIAARSLDEAAHHGSTFVTDYVRAILTDPRVEVVVEATGSPEAGLSHALTAIEHGKHVIMVNVEGDVLAGAILAEKAARAGVVYSYAYGDQPALICELVDTVRTNGFIVTAAGKGNRFVTGSNEITPDTVWASRGITAEKAKAAGMNPQMFTSFTDGTKAAIESAAVANACGMESPSEGLLFPPCGIDDLPGVMRPASEGGVLEAKNRVEIAASTQRDGTPIPNDLRWGVFVVFEGPSDYACRCFGEYGVRTDSTGRYAAIHRPFHLIGLELGVSIASAALRGESTGNSREFRADVAAVAKKDLAIGEVLDGEGGYTVWGRCLPAATSLARNLLPVGLAHSVRTTRAVKAGEAITWGDVTGLPDSDALRLRRELEARHRAAHAFPALAK